MRNRSLAPIGGDHLHPAALDHPAALAVLIVRAVGEHELEAAVLLEQQLRADLHDSVQRIEAGIFRVAGRTASSLARRRPTETPGEHQAAERTCTHPHRSIS